MSAPASTAASPILVDVILPAYNGSQVIRKALDSALSQDVPLKVIVVDDGSSDDTAGIALSYGSRVTVITQANTGVSGARNTGLAAARAPYIALLDQDDVWQRSKITRQLQLLEAHPGAGLVFTDMTLLKSDGTIVEDGFLLTTPPYAALNRRSLGDSAYLLPKELAEAVVRFNFISPSTVLLRRQAIQQIGGFDEAFRLCDDAECWMRLLHRWGGIAIEERLVLSLLWAGNASFAKAYEVIRERIRIGEKAAARPELYPVGTADYFRKERPVSNYQLGIGSLHAGDSRAAREYFLASLRDRIRLPTILAFVATLLPAFLRQGLLRIKRSTGVRWTMRVE